MAIPRYLVLACWSLAGRVRSLCAGRSRDRRVLGSALTAAFAVATICPQPASADFSPKDGQILGRTLGYVNDGTARLAVVGIVFAPANEASRHEAELIGSVIGDGMITGRVRLQARLVAVEQLPSATGLSALYVTSGLADSMEAIFTAARRLRIPTVSNDLTCVETGRCVVGFSSEPTVQILINQGAAERTGVHFLQAFRMLVREQ